MLLVRTHLDSLKALKGLISVLRDPNDVASIFDITNALRETKSFRRMIETVRSEPKCSAIIEERYNGPVAKLDELLKRDMRLAVRHTEVAASPSNALDTLQAPRGPPRAGEAVGWKQPPTHS